MSIIAFQKPENVIMTGATETYARFEFRPLEPGYGITIGNALRRILLSSLEGYAITSLRIDGVDHEFAAIPGVIEDVTNIVLNLKQIRFKQIVPDTDEEVISINIEKKETLTAGDLNAQLTAFKVLNPDLLICHLDKSVSIHMILCVNKGRGYVPADENRVVGNDISTIAVDSIYTPIRNVKYFIENFRVEQKTDFEKLVMEVTTDGSIHPMEAVKEAAKILIQHFSLFADETITVEESIVLDESEYDEETLKTRQLLLSELSEMDLSVRALNCLDSAGLKRLADLVAYQESELLKLRNFGKKSLGELRDLLVSLGLSFGMDISKYKLENE